MKRIQWCVAIVLAAALLLPALPSQAASSVKKRPLIERINGSLEKSRRVRQNKAKAREVEAYEAKQKQGNKQQAASAPTPAHADE